MGVVHLKRSWLEVDFKKLEKNYELVKKLAPDKEVLGVIKANGYGCGAAEVAKELKRLGVKIFGVACLQEGIELRAAGIEEEILVFGATCREEFEEAFDNKLQISVTRYEDIEYIEKNNFYRPKVHIKVDTGMGRIGFRNFKREDLLNIIKNSKKMEIMGIYSHFSCSDVYTEDQYTEKQIEKFSEFEQMEEVRYRHIQNSAGIILDNNLCYGNLVRAGIMLYGYSNLHEELQPITKLKSRLVHYKIVEQDSFISYGKEGFIKKGGMVGTISIGYADGYSRRFSNVGVMYIEGIPCKILGKVCMDVTMVEIPEELWEKLYIGMEVDVLGENIHEELSKAGVSPYEYLVGITNRVKKIYT